MPNPRTSYPYRKRRPLPSAGPVTRFTISGVRPDQLYPRIDTLHWATGTITSAGDPHLIALAIEQAQAHGLDLSNPAEAQQAIAGIFMDHTVKISG